jgi:Ser/Thr protein kinase RdoA (MazF antagonist)
VFRIPKLSCLLRLRMSRQQVSSNRLREIDQVLARYDLGHWQLIRPLLGGRSSDNFWLKTDRGPKVLKKYRWSVLSITQEHSILRYLNDTDFPFPRLTPNRDGETCTELNGEHYAIYDFIDGFRYDEYYMPARLEHRLIAQAAETLAHLHQLMEGFVPEKQTVDGFTPDGERLLRDTAWHLDTLDRFVQGISRTSPNSLDTLVQRNLDKLRRDLADSGHWYEQIHLQWPKLVIHNDYVGKNVVFDSDGLAGVLDFRGAVLDLRAADIARALKSFARQGRYGLDARKARTFLEAYQTRIPLLDDEVALVPKLLRWRLLRFAIRRLQSRLPASHQRASFYDRWAQACWLEKNENRFLDALLSKRASTATRS